MSQFSGSSAPNKSTTSQITNSFSNQQFNNATTIQDNTKQNVSTISSSNPILLDLDVVESKGKSPNTDLLDLFGVQSAATSTNYVVDQSTNIQQPGSDIQDLFGGLSLVNDTNISDKKPQTNNTQAAQGNSIDDLFGLQFN